MDAACARKLGDRSDVDAVRATLATMIERGAVAAALDLVVELLAQVRDANDALRIRLENALRQLYGRRSEKLSPGQLELFKALAQTLAAPAAPDAPSTDAAPDDATPPPASTVPAKPRARPHGRSERPTGLPCERTEVPVPEPDRICARCGARMQGFGAQESWRVEFVPGRFVLQVAACEKVACARCRDAVVTAPAPPAVIPGSPVGPGLLARILVDKAEDHLPLDRQHKRLAREGFTVPLTTLEGWWAQGADLLMPLQAALIEEALSAFVPQIDATGLDVRDKTHPKGIAKEHLWCAIGQRAIVFTFAPDKTQGLADLLGVRTVPADAPGAPVQGDGDGSFEPALRQAGRACVVLGCNMHARRYFERALKSGDLRAGIAMQLYAKIYAIERQATADGASWAERTRRRQEHTVPLLEQFRAWALSIRAGVNPSSPLGKALGYAERRWLGLTVFVLDGRIPLDTGEVERANRWIAKGRDNWNYSGSPAGAKRLAIVASVCATCRRLGIDPWAYLRNLFTAIADGLTVPQMLRDWTPWAWAQQQAQQPRPDPPATPT